MIYAVAVTVLNSIDDLQEHLADEVISAEVLARQLKHPTGESAIRDTRATHSRPRGVSHPAPSMRLCAHVATIKAKRSPFASR